MGCATDIVAPRVGAWIEISLFLRAPAVRMRSLPVWERGLKSLELNWGPENEVSLPVWERGLKYNYRLRLRYLIPSLPVWERGLKFFAIFPTALFLCRSPCGSVD